MNVFAIKAYITRELDLLSENVHISNYRKDTYMLMKYR